MEDHFLSLAAAVGAEAGDHGYYRGTLGHAPFLLKMTESDTPGYFFKFRRKGLVKQSPLPAGQAAWHEKLPADHAAAEIRCDVEEDYVFLWVDRPLELDAGALTELATACVRDHAGLFPDEEQQCMNCHQSGSAALVQANSSISTICPECLEQKRQNHEVANEKLNASHEHYAFLIPVGVLLGGVCWALFWGGYDAIFKIAKTESFRVPTMLLVVVAACGFGIGWPTGKILHRAGASKQSSPLGLAVFFGLLIAGLGEVMYATYTAHRLTGAVDVNLIRDITLPFILGDNPMYGATKVGFAIMAGLGIYEAAKRKEKKLAI